MIFVSNCFATAAGPRLRWFVLRTIVLQNRGVCSSWYSQGCSPDYCASGKAKGLKQLRPGLIARSRAECEHRWRALKRAAHASLLEPLLNDLFAGQFDSAAADGLASISRPLRHGAPCASGADPTSSPARAVDRLPPPSCHLHVATAATLASHPSTAAVAAPPCLPSHQMSAAGALPPTPISRQTSPRPRAHVLPSPLPVSLRAPLLFSTPTPRPPPIILTKYWDAPRLGLQDRSSARCTVAQVTAPRVYLLCGTSPIRKLESATSSHRVASEPSKGMSNELRTNSPACHCAVG